MNKAIRSLLLTCLVFHFSLNLEAQTELTWKELKQLDEKGQLPKKTKAKIGQDIKVRGFMMPLDYSAKKIAEFLLMPYIPTCMHVPTPSANQIILVKMKSGQEVAPSFYPIEVTGKLQVDESKEFEASYSMVGIDLKELDEKQQAELESNAPTHQAP